LLVTMPLVLALGWLSWHFVETPALSAARALGARGSLAPAADSFRPAA
jgi:peptidoglycan/LPS O-acetylase OafA/YrhL